MACNDCFILFPLFSVLKATHAHKPASQRFSESMLGASYDFRKWCQVSIDTESSPSTPFDFSQRSCLGHKLPCEKYRKRAVLIMKFGCIWIDLLLLGTGSL